MNSFYSIIRYVNNQWSNENIAVGLLAVSGEKVFFKISDHKINIAKKLNPEPFKLLKFSLDQFKYFINSEENKLKEHYQLNISNEKSQIDHSFVERLHQYNSGVLQFSEPEKISKIFDKESFEVYFRKIIDNAPEKEIEKPIITEFQQAIIEKLHKPLMDKVDVNYPLKKKSLPDLYFDYHLESIGVNGAIVASTSINFNHERIDVIVKNLSEFEAVIERLKSFASSKGIGSDHHFYLIADSYKGTFVSNQEIDGMLQNGVKDKFKRISADEVDVIVKQVKEKDARKISELLD